MNSCQLTNRLRPKLDFLYGSRVQECLDGILALIERVTPITPLPAWDQRDVVLITYGDQISQPDCHPLATLGHFLAETELDRQINTVHLLPFFPYSSDDGFSVIDYRQVDPNLGDWSDVEALGKQCSLMFDLVLNHISRKSRWFKDYASGVEPYTHYFIEVEPDTDTLSVTRPRNLPLLTPVETSRGSKLVWTTFSADQVDLNFSEPDVLLAMLDVLLFYVQQGARIIRLDAIAYLWKELKTSCIHRPQTHVVVKIMRDLLDVLAPGTILLTETNVPHEENVSYFGDGDEAQMIYQFSLAPLLLEALLSGDAGLLVDWLSKLEPPPSGATVFNFTASHDGIGVRPLEGLMPPERFRKLVDAVKARGGLVSTKQNADGTESPYELNITYFSALGEPDRPDSDVGIKRFLASQAIMLSLQGIPGVYFHSLVATPNDETSVQKSGSARSINRRKFTLSELLASLDPADSPQAKVFNAYRRMLTIRTQQPAFHPDASQLVFQFDNQAPAQISHHGVPLLRQKQCSENFRENTASNEAVAHCFGTSLVGFLRTSVDQSQNILVLANVGPKPLTLDVHSTTGESPTLDLLSPTSQPLDSHKINLSPYQVSWLLCR